MLSLSPVYVLHSRRFGDTSAILDCYSQCDGRVSLMAKGGLADKKRQSLLQPFTPLLAQWVGRGEVQTLTKVEAADKPLSLHGKRLYCGLYLNELLLRLTTKNDASLSLFAQYCHTLDSLVGTDDIELTLRQFEVALLKQIGHMSSLSVDSDGQVVSADRQYHYEVGIGAVLEPLATVSTVSGAVLIGLDNGDLLDSDMRRQARNLMRRILAVHLGNKPLKSRELFQELL